MAVYCENCGAELNEKDVFCGKCGTPVAKGGSAEKGGEAGAKNYRVIGIEVVAVAVLVVGGLVLKGMSGGKRGDGDGGIIEAGNRDGGIIGVGNEMEEEDEVVAHLKPWMGEWMVNFEAAPSMPRSLQADHEGYYSGRILKSGNTRGSVHVNEQYIDFSDFTKDQKDCLPVSALTYYESEYGADVFEDKDSGRRIMFYKHFVTVEDHGEIMKIEAYVGDVEPEVYYLDGIPIGVNHRPDPDGWAADCGMYFIRVDD